MKSRLGVSQNFVKLKNLLAFFQLSFNVDWSASDIWKLYTLALDRIEMKTEK